MSVLAESPLNHHVFSCDRVVKGGGFLKVEILQWFGQKTENMSFFNDENVQSLLDVKRAICI